MSSRLAIQSPSHPGIQSPKASEHPKHPPHVLQDGKHRDSTLDHRSRAVLVPYMDIYSIDFSYTEMSSPETASGHSMSSPYVMYDRIQMYRHVFMYMFYAYVHVFGRVATGSLRISTC
jgi:hypothetical protein